MSKNLLMSGDGCGIPSVFVVVVGGGALLNSLVLCVCDDVEESSDDVTPTITSSLFAALRLALLFFAFRPMLPYSCFGW